MKTNAIKFDVFVGPAGAGKDTFTKRLAREIPNSTRLSTGDICRGAKSGKGRYGYYHDEMNAQTNLMDSGGLISDEVALSLTKQAVMKAFVFGTNHFFMTGFPRNVAQLDEFNLWGKELEELTGVPIETRFIHLDLDPATADSRRRMRVEEARAKGQEPRKDDREEVFQRRAKEYETHTLPLIDALAREGRLKTVHVNGSLERNYSNIRAALGLIHSSYPERR